MPETRKNVVLCSDGTGQAGTKARGSNVWRLRMAVDRHDHERDEELRRQIVFYDQGVGTSAMSVKKMLGGAFGYGLAESLRLLYIHLARAYEEGDNIYIFGFSRGAFMARSLAGMISELGVIEGKRDNEELEELVRRAYGAYRASNRKKPTPIEKFQTECLANGITIHKPRIHFVGVWDTVDAYGMPIDELRVLIYDTLLYNIRRPHNMGATDKIDCAYHALAIDDDRHTFSPSLYDEAKAKACGMKVDQVWFAGAHSNVGGGYPRQGLSDVALDWMMSRAERHGLRFTQGAKDEVARERDVHSTLYDQRTGPGVIWRYCPRNVGELCKRSNTPPRIHISAMDRMELATAHYGPITLPKDFRVVGTDRDDEKRAERYNELVEESADYRERESVISWKHIRRRRNIYRVFLVCLTAVGVLAALVAYRPGFSESYRGFSSFHRLGSSIGESIPAIGKWIGPAWDWAEKAAQAMLPGALDRIIEAVFDLPEFAALVVLIGVGLLWASKSRVRKMRHQGMDTWRRVFDRNDSLEGLRRS